MTEILFARKTDVDNLIAANIGAVRYDIVQTLTAPQQAQALANISGASTVSPTFSGTTTLGPNVTPAANVRLVVNNNTVAVPLAGFTGITEQIAAADNTLNRLQMIGSGGSGISIVNFMNSGGTLASPSATPNGQIVGAFGGAAYGTTGYNTTGGAGILFTTTEIQTDTHQGMGLSFATTPNGTATQVTALTIQASGGVSIGTTTDLGVGSLLVKTKAVIGSAIVPVSGTLLTISGNTVTPPSSDVPMAVQIVSPDNVQTVVVMDSFGGIGKQSFLLARNARGTAASPTALLSGDQLGFFGMTGAYGAGTYISSNGANGGIFFGGVAAENWSVTNQGCSLRLYTTPLATASIAEAVRVQPSGGVSIGSTAVGTDPGLGNLLVQNFINSGGFTRVTTQFDKTSDAALANVPGLSVALIAGKSYIFRAVIYTTAGAGGINVVLTGTATATSVIWTTQYINGGTVSGSSPQTSLGSGIAIASGSTTLYLDGVITVNASGTLALQFAQNSSNVTTSSVRVGSYLEVLQVT